LLLSIPLMLIITNTVPTFANCLPVLADFTNLSVVIPNEVKEIGYKEISDNFEQFLRSLHYLNWLNKQEIVNMSVEELMRLLQTGLDSFNYVEALELFKRSI